MDPHEFLSGLPSLGKTQEDLPICAHPIFIIGSPRSATTILAWSLAQHSQLWTSDESQILWDLFGDGRLNKNYQRDGRPDGSWLRKQGIEKAEFLRFLGLGLNALFTSKSEGKRWIDQTPFYTLMVDELVNMFPGAFFIHILRDGRAVVNSMIHYRDRFDDKVASNCGKKDFAPWATDFRGACRTWSQYVEVSLAFGASYPARCLTVVNEQLVANPSRGFREIFDFIRVPEEDSPANYFQSNRINSSFSRAGQKSSKIPKILEIWEGWTTNQKGIFQEEAGRTLEKYGSVSDARIKDPGLVLRICQIARAVVPTAATVMIVSKGDNELLNFLEQKAWHFPQVNDGAYAGYHPGDSSEAIEHLEALRARGGEFLLFPNTAFWWLDHYVEFRQHLDSRYGRIWSDENCIIYQLSK
jgi:hypothetical protein